MAYHSSIPVDRNNPLPPPASAYVRYKTRSGMVAETGAPLYPQAAWMRAKEYLARGCEVCYTFVLTYSERNENV